MEMQGQAAALTYTRKQEEAVIDWAKKTILKDAVRRNNHRCLSLGISLGTRQVKPLSEPFETIRAAWRALWGQKQ